MQLVVGRVGRPHGIRGEVSVEVRTDDPEVRFAAGSVLATDPSARGPLTVERWHWHSGRLLLTFAGVTSREAAEALRDTLLVVDSADLPVLADPDEFYDHELVGLRAELADGVPLGTVAEVVHAPAGDLLAIERLAGGELLVPFLAAMVPVVDVAGGRVVVEPPDGLLDL
ncbi:MAG TPA: ribosome maturation factor RimM [Mycobacteriales bacterium]|nr:ribosome maturation factor RimM [Mycobacteriales bacterium]